MRLAVAVPIVVAVAMLPCAVASGQEGARLIEEVLVTGTRIRKANLDSASPVTEVAAEDLLLGGVTRVEDLLRHLPQVYSRQNSGVSNGFSGTATVELRNLGAQRTLVLVDGRRLPSGSPFAVGSADINQIPGALIDHIEVLTGGASAVYGSDAVAGVVNFFLVDDFEGVKLDAQFSQYAHDNDDASMARLLENSGYAVPSGTVRDGDTTEISLMLGRNLADDRGNVTFYATYRDIEAVVQADRVHSACALDGNASDGYVCDGSAIIPEGVFWDGGLLEADLGLPGYLFMVQDDEFVDYDGRTYNFAPLNYFQRPDERWTSGLLARYRFNDSALLSAQLMYMEDRTVAQIAPTVAFRVPVSLSCSNPLLSAQQVEALCGAYDLAPEDSQPSLIFRRNAEGGPRRFELNHRSYHGVLGLQGELNDIWRYDLYAQYAEVRMEEAIAGEFLNSRIMRALSVSADPATGEPVCDAVLIGSDPDCVPWNIFREGGITPAALDYLSTPLTARGGSDQLIFSGYVAGNLGEYGLRSPFAESGAELVVGAEYRDESLDYDPDAIFLSGDAAGGASPPFVLSGGFDVTEFYTELSIPLAEQQAAAESLALDLGYRYSDYSTGETTDTYKLALTWSPVSALRLRASFQHAVRLPNIQELFEPLSPSAFELPGDRDPCAGATPQRSFEACARSGVTRAQYGTIPELPEVSTSFTTRTGGNPGLRPEDSDTRSMGFLYTPGWAEDLTLSLDWYDIEIDGAIASIDPAITLNSCLDTGEPFFCNQVHRDPERGDLWRRGGSGSGFVDGILQNLGSLATSGYDLTLDWVFDLGAGGSLEMRSILTYVEEWRVSSHPGAPALECTGKWGAECTSVIPELRNYLRFTWRSPWNVDVSLLWRYIDELEHIGGGGHIDAYDYFDLALLWQVTDKVEVRAGINNLLDKAPPIILADPPVGNGNTFPGVYDALGQYLFAGVSVSF